MSLGVLEVIRISLAGGQPNDPALTNMFMYEHGQPHLQHWRNEALSVNDCFFRNMDEYKYIVNIDNDEMILSLNHTNWDEMMEDLEKETVNKVLYEKYNRHPWILTWHCSGQSILRQSYLLSLEKGGFLCQKQKDN